MTDKWWIDEGGRERNTDSFLISRYSAIVDGIEWYERKYFFKRETLKKKKKRVKEEWWFIYLYEQ